MIIIKPIIRFIYFDDLKTIPIGSGVFANATYEETKTSYVWKRGTTSTTSIIKSMVIAPIKTIINHYNFLTVMFSTHLYSNPNEHHAISYEFHTGATLCSQKRTSCYRSDFISIRILKNNIFDGDHQK